MNVILLVRGSRTVLMLSLAILARSPAKASDFFDHFWPETDVYVKLSENTRLFGLLAGTKTQAGGYTDGQLGIHGDWFTPAILNRKRMERLPDIAKNKFLQIRLGYLFGTTPANSPDPFVEHTAVVELTPRF
jgi:hypothetical protein